jgi:hypothetical protein
MFHSELQRSISARRLGHDPNPGIRQQRLQPHANDLVVVGNEQINRHEKQSSEIAARSTQGKSGRPTRQQAAWFPKFICSQMSGNVIRRSLPTFLGLWPACVFPGRQHVPMLDDTPNRTLQKKCLVRFDN